MPHRHVTKGASAFALALSWFLVSGALLSGCATEPQPQAPPASVNATPTSAPAAKQELLRVELKGLT